LALDIAGVIVTDLPPSGSASLTSILLETGIVTQAQLDYAHVWRAQSGHSIGETLVEMKAATEEDIGWALARQLGIPFVDVRADLADVDLIRSFPDALLRRHQAIPLVRDESCVSLAMADPTQADALESLERAAGCPLSLSVAAPSAIRRVLEETLRGPGRQRVERSEHTARYDVDWDRSGAIFLVLHLTEALRSGATEIHFVSERGEMRIHHRIAHRLVLKATEPDNVVYSLLGRLESLGGPTIDGQQVHAMGRVTCPVGNDEIPLDVSLFNGADGISVTLRLHTEPTGAPTLADLGLDAVQLAGIRSLLDRPGLIIVAGPPHAGCSTTLACLLAEAESSSRRAIAFQTRPAFTLTANRVELDAVEARRSWAEIAAAQCMDLVALDDVLCGDAIEDAIVPAAAGRLILVRTDWTDSFALLDHVLSRPGARHLLANRLHAILQQRLVHTSAADHPDRGVIFGHSRRALFEVLLVSDTMRQALRDGRGAEHLRAIASEEGFRGLAEEAERWVAANLLSEADAARVRS
jgi:Tfp pilus assembly pilus retraction ATPase PilT